MDQNAPQPSPRQQVLVMWVLWAAFLVGCVVQFFFLHSKKPGPAGESQLWLVGLVPVAASLFIRYSLIPKVTALQPALVLLVLGVALAESALFIGIFVFTPQQLVLFAAALIGIAQHAPTYAARLVPPPEN